VQEGREALRELIRGALAEDAAQQDITTIATIPPDAKGRARLISREPCVIAGMEAFATVFMEQALADRSVVEVAIDAADGSRVSAGEVVATIEGLLRTILTAERTALNLVQRMSGIATLTARFVERASDVEIRDTRKTTPGLRVLEKAAVRAGGGTNHRKDLAAAILIKDNHISAAGGIAEAINAARAAYPQQHLEIECDTIDQVRIAIEVGADEILLDNMDVKTLRKAVELINGRARTEASGGITLDNVAEIAATGIDAISVGALTHSAPAVDLSLEVEAV
jgi:nicotinate-nucleotide pyrophosphorylase (carboxylating)